MLAGSLYPSPTDETFPALSPAPKPDPDINYNAMPETMFTPEQSAYSGG